MLLLALLRSQSVVAQLFILCVMKISVHATDVKTKLRAFSIEVAVEEKEQMDEEGIVVRLRKVCGASSFKLLRLTNVG